MLFTGDAAGLCRWRVRRSQNVGFLSRGHSTLAPFLQTLACIKIYSPDFFAGVNPPSNNS
jgi:hypothetical protein